MHDQGKALARVSRSPFQHLLITIGISECSDWPATNKYLNADWLSLFVIDKLHFGQSQQLWFPIPDVVLHFAAAADDLLRRNAVSLFGKATHELNAATGHNERLEAGGTQIREQLEHGLINHLRVEAPGLRMFCGTEPIFHDL